MYPKELLLSDKLRSAHSTSWQRLARLATFLPARSAWTWCAPPVLR